MDYIRQVDLKLESRPPGKMCVYLANVYAGIYADAYADACANVYANVYQVCR